MVRLENQWLTPEHMYAVALTQYLGRYIEFEVTFDPEDVVRPDGHPDTRVLLNDSHMAMRIMMANNAKNLPNILNTDGFTMFPVEEEWCIEIDDTTISNRRAYFCVDADVAW